MTLNVCGRLLSFDKLRTGVTRLLVGATAQAGHGGDRTTPTAGAVPRNDRKACFLSNEWRHRAMEQLRMTKSRCSISDETSEVVRTSSPETSDVRSILSSHHAPAGHHEA